MILAQTLLPQIILSNGIAVFFLQWNTPLVERHHQNDQRLVVFVYIPLFLTSHGLLILVNHFVYSPNSSCRVGSNTDLEDSQWPILLPILILHNALSYF